MDRQGSRSGQDWAERFTNGVAANVREWRQYRGLSLQDLAAKCTELGYKTLRTTLANLESGSRKSVGVHEILVLATALDVPPLVLIIGGLPLEPVEFLPDTTQAAWHTAKWFTGEPFLPGTEVLETPRLQLHYLRQIDQASALHIEALNEALGARAEVDRLRSELDELEPGSPDYLSAELQIREAEADKSDAEIRATSTWRTMKSYEEALATKPFPSSAKADG